MLAFLRLAPLRGVGSCILRIRRQSPSPSGILPPSRSRGLLAAAWLGGDIGLPASPLFLGENRCQLDQGTKGIEANLHLRGFNSCAIAMVLVCPSTQAPNFISNLFFAGNASLCLLSVCRHGVVGPQIPGGLPHLGPAPGVHLDHHHDHGHSLDSAFAWSVSTWSSRCPWSWWSSTPSGLASRRDGRVATHRGMIVWAI